MRPAPHSDEPFARLLARHGLTRGAVVRSVSLSRSLANGTDPNGIIGYLAALGIQERSPNDLLLINQHGDEEELSAHPVQEGVALTIASQGDWVLFRP